MSLGHWNVQFLNQNSQRSYPLTEAATKTDTSGTVTLPNDFIVALYFPVHAGQAVEPQNFYLRGVTVTPAGYTLEIGYDDNTASPPLVAVVSIPASAHTQNRTYAVAGVDDFDDSVGNIAIGRLDGVAQLAPGDYSFLPAAGAIEVDAIRPMKRGVSSVAVVSASGDRSERYYGDVEFVAGSNFRITAAQVAGGRPQITFSAIRGEGLNEECECDEGSDGVPIKTINGVGPRPDGNLTITGDDCTTITPIANGLRLTDACSEPCCGCEELQALEGQIDRFADGVVTLQNFVNNLGAQSSQFFSSVLGSRLQDNGCLEC